jgi:hypothetical protein
MQPISGKHADRRLGMSKKKHDVVETKQGKWARRWTAVPAVGLLVTSMLALASRWCGEPCPRANHNLRR